MQEIYVCGLPGNEGEHAFNRERSAINEISIEKVLIIDCRETIQFKDVIEIVVLPMDISTDSDLFILLDLIAYQ
jgi:N-glycosylase/DNA lyase